MKLTLLQIQKLDGAMRALDGYQHGGQVFHYNLPSPVRKAIRKNLIVTEGELQTFQDVSNDLIKSMATPDTPNVVAKERNHDFQNEIDKLMKASDEYTLKTIKEVDLGLDGDTPNPIPGSVLAALDPIIEDTA